MRKVLMIGLLLSGLAVAKESKIDLNKNVAINREVVQLLERSKKLLQSEKGQNAHRQRAIEHIMSAMGEVRSQTSKPGH
ncbi:hypothetical protein JST97_37785 [bacterium]|nr:hypothetical protein [bacterium]